MLDDIYIMYNNVVDNAFHRFINNTKNIYTIIVVNNNQII